MSKRNLKVHLLTMVMAMVLILCGFTPVSAASDVKINKESMTIVSGATYQLQVTVNGSVVNASWGSSNTSVATVDSTGLVTGKAAGSAVITAMVNGTTVECLVSVLKKSVSSTYRYNVLILDASGSMKGTPNTSQKLAAQRFCQKVLSTDGYNYVAIVALNSSSKTLCGFTNNYNTLDTYINSIYPNGSTNMNRALSLAGSLLNGVSDNGNTVMKNIILCSDGLPNVGEYAYSGRYDSNDHRDYKYANSAYSTASQLKKKNYFIYALGFFHNSKGNDLKFGKRLMKDLASKDKYYVIQDANDLENVFDNISDVITKTTMNKSSVTLKAGRTCQLYALVNGSKKTASWKSSDFSVAGVDQSGKVTAKKAGTATITATVDGKSVTCKVTVKPKLTLNKSKSTLYVGEKLLLKATVKGSSKTVTWKSNNSSVASVNSDGVVEGKAVGKAVISATVEGVTAKCTITVKKASHPLYSMYFKFPRTKHNRTQKDIDELGIRIQLNDGAVIEKCGAYMKKSGSYWYCTMAFKGENITSAILAGYLSNEGKTVYDAMSSSYLNKFSMSKDSNGIWSVYGKYQTIQFNVFDTAGKNVANIATGKQSENTTIFTDLDKMKAWLAK